MNDAESIGQRTFESDSNLTPYDRRWSAEMHFAIISRLDTVSTRTTSQKPRIQFVMLATLSERRLIDTTIPTLPI